MPTTDAPLRLAFVASQDPRVAANGVNSHSRNLKAALKAAGMPVWAELDPVHAQAGRQRLFASRVLGRLGRDVDRRALGDLTTRHAILAQAARADARLVQADVVHAQDFVAATACLDALGSACPPIVLAHHANGLPADELRSRLGLGPDAASVRWAAEASARAFARAARVVAVSPWAADVLAAEGNVERSRLAVVLNGVPVSATPTDPSVRVPGRILAVGQLVERKGFDVLVRALAALPAPREGAVRGAVGAVVLGEGPARAGLEAQARELGAPVVFAGVAASDDVAAEMARASLFALPSRAENLPMALLEAMAAALPSVGSAVGGVAAALDAESDEACGLVVAPDDVAALGVALARLLDDRAGAQAMGLRAHARARALYGMEAMARQWLAVYRDATGRAA
jgi:glycosyltransferase involved in cell wall biosynthesis